MNGLHNALVVEHWESRLWSKVKPYYQDDLITLYHGDCLEVTTWLEGDVMVTDPPYGIEWMVGTFDTSKIIRDQVRDRRKLQGGDIANDHDTQARDDVLALWGDTKPAVVFGTWRKDRPPGVKHRLIWHKQGRFPGVNPSAWYSNDEEIYLIGSGWQGKPTPSVISTQESRSSHAKSVGHPTPKPIGLMEILINKCAPGVIVDPFAGSGSTLLAARNSGRQAIGVEIDERYCQMIADRFSQGVLI